MSINVEELKPVNTEFYTQPTVNSQLELRDYFTGGVKEYLLSLGKNKINTSELNLYQTIIQEIEAPLFRTIMELTRYNQSKAARVLGVSRGTLRTKLKQYFDDEFIGIRD